MTRESATIDAPAEPQRLAPVAPNERVLALDVLRGIALFGVLTANIWLWFSGVVFRFPAYNADVWSFSPDSIAFLFIAFFISGKAITTFSFLFGIGFAVQMMRAVTRGRSIVRHHSRRLAILFLFGAVHAVFLWYGDILTAYALLGFGLLLFRRRRDRTLLIWATVLIVVVPILSASIPVIMAVVTPDTGPEPAVILGKMTATNTELLALFASGDPAQIVRGNLQMLQQQWLTPKALFLLSVFGIFLLGLYAGRRRMFEDPQAHRPLLRRTVIYGFALGITGTALNLGLRSIPPEEFMAITLMPLAMAVTTAASTVPFALAYIAAATLLLQRAAWRERLSHFAPVGRMALTNYLAQTVICISIFYGGGLVGEAGPLFGLVLALVIFPLQMAFSAWWLMRFRYGPMEWLWRSLTYGRAQPMRLAHAPAPVAAASIKLRVLLIGTLAPTVLAACAGPPEAVLSADLSPAAVTLTQTCTSLRGTAVDVQDDLKVLNARLQGDVSGTLQIIEHTQWQAGVVERSSATYTVEVEPGAVLFGDGIAGRVPPSGGTHGTTYRYGAEGNVEGGTGVYSEMTGRWEIDGWISDGTTATQLDYRMVLCAR